MSHLIGGHLEFSQGEPAARAKIGATIVKRNTWAAFRAAEWDRRLRGLQVFLFVIESSLWIAFRNGDALGHHLNMRKV